MRIAGCQPTIDRAPAVARLGFDHGWLRLGPSFLNFGFATLLVDHRLIGDPYALGFEHFGSRNPRLPFPLTRLRADPWSRNSIQLYAARGEPGMGSLLARSSFVDPHGTAWYTAAKAMGLVLLTAGDTYEVDLNWAALWHCAIGFAQMLPASAVGNASVPNHRMVGKESAT